MLREKSDPIELLQSTRESLEASRLLIEPRDFFQLKSYVRDGERNLQVEKNDSKYIEVEKEIKPNETVEEVETVIHRKVAPVNFNQTQELQSLS